MLKYQYSILGGVAKNATKVLGESHQICGPLSTWKQPRRGQGQIEMKHSRAARLIKGNVFG